ncbi:MAG: aminotransferase class I/II-fold pyridoxal phosphate-dependent enzyme [Planctomycetota bacterium]|jgi:N-succinyldiaminopimelate aminotransferase
MSTQRTCRRLRPFGETIFAEMTRLAQRHDAVNLGQGFPDFEGPPEIIAAAVAAMEAGENQYARSRGHPLLVEAIAKKQQRDYGILLDPMTDVVVTSGCTEAIAASLLGLLDPGDEVILFEPYYDSYCASIALAGAVPRFVTLRFPDFALDVESLRAAVTEKTKLILVNTPHNPVGKVFSRTELQAIADLAIERDLIVVTDEVYEYLTFDGVEHVPMATLDGMFERTLTLSSTGKTFSFTGWKIGWAGGPAPLVDACSAAHQFLTFAVARPFQVAMAHALDTFQGEYLARFRADYTVRRDVLVDALRFAGFEVAVPQGTYFVCASHRPLSSKDDRAYAEELIESIGVASIPPSCFYTADKEEGKKLLRFAFCKQLPTLEEGAARLRRLSS